MHPYARITTLIRYSIEELEASATGFFYRADDGEVYLITNRHVVKHETGASPEKLRISLREEENPGRTYPEYIDLFDEGKPKWLEYPPAPNSDIVAIPLDFDIQKTANQPVSEGFVIDIFTDIVFTGSRAVTVGYPLRIKDQLTSAPVVRDTLVSSQYGLPYNGKAAFLTDAQIHDGMSGSPVFIAPGQRYLHENKNMVDLSDEEGNPAIGLLGVISGNYEINGIRTNLNITWYGGILDQIVNQDDEVSPWRQKVQNRD